jgi:hypothetical protein
MNKHRAKATLLLRKVTMACWLIEQSSTETKCGPNEQGHYRKRERERERERYKQGLVTIRTLVLLRYMSGAWVHRKKKMTK